MRREYGWRTDRMSRQQLFDELRASFNAGHLTIPNRYGLDEFSTIIAAPGENRRQWEERMTITSWHSALR